MSRSDRTCARAFASDVWRALIFPVRTLMTSYVEICFGPIGAFQLMKYGIY